MSTQTQHPILVTGASGHLGRGVLHHLLHTEHIAPHQIIATTRNPTALAEFSALGVDVRQADFDTPATLEKAFAGAKRLLLISTDAIDAPGRRLEQHRQAIDAAIAAGIEHVVYTSLPDPEHATTLIAPDHAATEKFLAESPLSWTILRNNWYFENLYFSLPHILASGQWFTASGEGRIAHIARDDIGRAAAAVLASSDNSRHTYTLTGEESFNTAEIAQLVGDIAGRKIEVIHVPDAGLLQGLQQAGLPEALAAVFASFDTNIRNDGLATVTDDYFRITRHRPQPYRDWLEANRSSITSY